MCFKNDPLWDDLEGNWILFMSYKKTHNLVLLVLTTFYLTFSPNTDLFAQSTSTEKPKIKDFGKSLKKFEKGKDNSREEKKKIDSVDGETIRVKTDLVINEVLVVDRKGNAILDLKENDFVVSENGVEQKTEVFSLGEKVTIPRSIVLIIDYSGSQFPFLKTSIESAKVLVDKLPSQDRMAIVTDDVELLVDFTKDKELLKKKLDSLYKRALSKRDGKSEQYTALLAVLNEMFDEEDMRPIVILQSDGDELSALKRTAPPEEGEYVPPLDKAKVFGMAPRILGVRLKNYSYEDVYSAVSKSRATIYSIVPGLRFINRTPEEQMKNVILMNERYRSALFEMWGIKVAAPQYSEQQLNQTLYLFHKRQLALLDIAKLSGGYLEFLEKPEDAEQVYTNIFTAMNNRYLIGYYPTNLEADGKRRDIKIEVKGHPDYIVVGRKTYFPPEQ